MSDRSCVKLVPSSLTSMLSLTFLSRCNDSLQTDRKLFISYYAPPNDLPPRLNSLDHQDGFGRIGKLFLNILE